MQKQSRLQLLDTLRRRQSELERLEMMFEPGAMPRTAYETLARQAAAFDLPLPTFLPIHRSYLQSIHEARVAHIEAMLAEVRS